MKKKINSDSVFGSFMENLDKDGISQVTIANYRSDINNFLSWFGRATTLSGVYVETLSDSLPFLKKETGRIYLSYLLQMKLPASSLNRALSSLRRLSGYLVLKGFLAFDFMEGTKNIRKYQRSLSGLDAGSFLAQFEKHLSRESSSKNTVKNYVSDVRHFLTWLEGKA